VLVWCCSPEEDEEEEDELPSSAAPPLAVFSERVVSGRLRGKRDVAEEEEESSEGTAFRFFEAAFWLEGGDSKSDADSGDEPLAGIDRFRGDAIEDEVVVFTGDLGMLRMVTPRPGLGLLLLAVASFLVPSQLLLLLVPMAWLLLVFACCPEPSITLIFLGRPRPLRSGFDAATFPLSFCAILEPPPRTRWLSFFAFVFLPADDEDDALLLQGATSFLPLLAAPAAAVVDGATCTSPKALPGFPHLSTTAAAWFFKCNVCASR